MFLKLHLDFLANVVLDYFLKKKNDQNVMEKLNSSSEILLYMK